MNLVDVGIIVVLGLAAAHGITQGAALQVLSFGGFWIGLLVGAALAPVFSAATASVRPLFPTRTTGASPCARAFRN